MEKLEEERARSSDLAAEVARLRVELDSGRKQVDDWTGHETKLFSLLPLVIRAARAEKKWPKQAAFVADLRSEYGISEAEAKALDAVTRPDSLRGR
jgi:hypothetical protein